MGDVLKITLKSARVNKNLSQKEAAQKAGVSNKTLSKWENGTSFPTAEKIDVLCEMYGVSYDNLIFLPANSLKAE